MNETSKRLIVIFNILYDHFGPLHWWPAETPFEVVVGAILTQNTAWINVEQAIDNLKQASVLSPEKMAEIPTHCLEELIKPSGYYRQKADRLQKLAEHLVQQWESNPANLCNGPLDEARSRLLELHGIGPETADSILLYAANRPSFVVDAYTKRIFARIGLLRGCEAYEEIRAMFMQNLPNDTDLYNEFHAQIVHLAKTCCTKNAPHCVRCPLNNDCCYAKEKKHSVDKSNYSLS